MENEATFTFDVERIKNGYLIHHNKEKVYRELSSKANEYIEATVMEEIKDHVLNSYPQGTAQRLVVTVGVSGKVME